MKLNGKLAVVTGASTGIGQAISVQMAKEGVFIILIARTKKGLEETLKIIKENGGKGKIIITDLASIQSLNKTISHIKSFSNRIDVLVNVAGIWHGKNEVYVGTNFEAFSPKVIKDTYTVGILAPTLLIHGFIPLMPKKAKIINISGTFESGAKGWLPYYASKRTIEDLSVGLSEELKDKDIQVNCISPSDTATEAYKKYFPQYIKDAINPQEIAKFAVYLCSKDNITGKVFVMKKGKKPYVGYHT